MAAAENLLNEEDGFMNALIDDYLTVTQIPVQISLQSALVIQYVFELNKEEENDG